MININKILFVSVVQIIVCQAEPVLLNSGLDLSSNIESSLPYYLWFQDILYSSYVDELVSSQLHVSLFCSRCNFYDVIKF